MPFAGKGMIEDTVADKGYHANETQAELHEHTTYRSYIPEPTSQPRVGGQATRAEGRSLCQPPADAGRTREEAAAAPQRASGAELRSRLRNRRRQTHLAHRNRKRSQAILISAAAHNLGLLMRSLFHIGTPRGLQELDTDLEGFVSSLHLAWLATAQRWSVCLRLRNPSAASNTSHTPRAAPALAA